MRLNTAEHYCAECMGMGSAGRARLRRFHANGRLMEIIGLPVGEE
jgi:hypothetical protein